MQINPKIIVVDDKNTILMVQEEFNRLFPYLKIEFLAVANTPPNHITNMFANEIKGPLQGFRTADNKEQLVITPDMSVAVLEEKFREIYRLKAQILRKSG